MQQPNVMTNAELLTSIRYLNVQLGYLTAWGFDDKSYTDADRAMIRERNDYDRELRRRAFGRAKLHLQD